MDIMRNIKCFTQYLLLIILFLGCNSEEELAVTGDLDHASNLNAIDGNVIPVSFSYSADDTRSNSNINVTWSVNRGEISGDSSFYKIIETTQNIAEAELTVTGVAQEYQIICCIERPEIRQCFSKKLTTEPIFPTDMNIIANKDKLSISGDTSEIAIVFSKGHKGISTNLLVSATIRYENTNDVVSSDIVYLYPPEVTLPALDTNAIQMQLITTGKDNTTIDKMKIEFNVSDGKQNLPYDLSPLQIELVE